MVLILWYSMSPGIVYQSLKAVGLVPAAGWQQNVPKTGAARRRIDLEFDCRQG